MNPERDKLQRRMQILQQRYTESLPDRIRQIEALWRQLVQQEENRQVFEQLLHSVHNLTGSGTIYGHPRISEVAANLEQALGEVQRSTRLPDTLREKIENALQDLHRAAGRSP